jgi:hypothetical protein
LGTDNFGFDGMLVSDGIETAAKIAKRLSEIRDSARYLDQDITDRFFEW